MSEKLEEVLRNDAQLLSQHNLRYADIAERLDFLLGYAMRKKNTITYKHYSVIIETFKGFQICPWATDPHHAQCVAGGGVQYGSISWTIFNQQKQIEISGPGLMVHLIRDHHFFEGIQSPYRIDPIKISRLLDLLE